MRTLMLLGGFGVVAVVLVGIWVQVWVDEGEVATLATFENGENVVHTELWIVDVDGRTYVRAAGPETDWLQRLEARPVVRLVRRGMVSRVRGVPSDDPAVREAVNRAMRQKYGSVDRVVSWIRDRSRCVPVWLEPYSPPSP